MKQQDTATSQKISPHLVLSATTIQDLLALEVDTQVLFQELSKLVALSGRIGDTFRRLRLSEQEQELPD